MQMYMKTHEKCQVVETEINFYGRINLAAILNKMYLLASLNIIMDFMK